MWEQLGDEPIYMLKVGTNHIRGHAWHFNTESGLNVSRNCVFLEDIREDFTFCS